MAERTIEVRLVASTAQFTAAFGAASAQVKTFSREVATTLATTDKKTQQHLEKISKGMLIAGGVIAAGFAASAKAAIDFESAFAGVRKTVDGTDAQMRTLSDGIRAMARTLPASATEIAGVAEAAGQLGIQRPAILAFARTMVDLGETTNLSADEAATSIARMINVMGTAQSDVDRMGATLVALGNAGASTESEILELAQRLASAGRTIGLTESDVLAFANTLSSLGIEAEAGGSAVSRVFIEMGDAVLDQNDKLDVFARTAGMSVSEFSAAFRDDAAGAVASFIEGLGRVVASGQSTTGILDELGFSELRVSRALRDTALGGDILRDSLELGSRAWKENNALQEEAEKRYKTTAAQLEIARNNIVDLGVGLGNELLPAVRLGTSFLVGFTDTLRQMPGPVQGTLSGIAGLSGTILLVGGAVGTLAPKVTRARESLQGLGTAGQFADRQLGRLGRVGGYALGFLAFVSAADQLTDVLTDLTQGKAPNLSRMGEALVEFGENGRVSGELAKQFGNDLEELGDKLRASTQIDKPFLDIFQEFSASKVRDAKRDLDAIDKQLAELVQRGYADEAARQFDLLAQAATEQGMSVLDLTGALNDYDNALAENRTEAALNSDGQEDLAGGYEDTEDAADDAAGAVDRLREAMDALIGIHTTAIQSEIDWRDELVNLREALDENVNSFDLATQAGRDNTSAFADAAVELANRVEAVYEHTRAVEGEAAALDAAHRAFDSGVTDLRNLAYEAGLTDDQTQTLLDSLGLAAGFGPIEAEFRTTGVERTISDIERVQGALGWTVNWLAPGAMPPRSAATTNGAAVTDLYGRLIGNAAGGLYADDAGMANRHQPHIAQAGAMRLFAEPETHGEGYIPLANDWRRPRAEGILAEIAQRFGGEFVKYAAGGIRVPVEIAFSTQMPASSTAARAGSRGAGGAAATAAAPANLGSVQALARTMAASRGWVGREWDSLYRLVQAESGWRPNAQNPTSTAYGLFQFLNSTWAGVGAQKTSDPAGQIRAGLQYIANRYGSPSKAWAFWNAQSPHWYRAGGLLLPGRHAGGRGAARSLLGSAFGAGGFAMPGSVQAFASGGWGRPDILRPRPNPNPDVALGPAREAEDEALAAEQAARDAQQALDEAARAADEARRRQRDIEDSMYATGRLNAMQYIALLEERLRAEEQFSSEWMAIHQERQRVLDDLARAEQDRYRHLVELHNNEFKLGRISLADHLGNLDRRMAREEKFSDEWMALYEERQRLVDEEADRIARSTEAFDTIVRSLGQAAADEIGRLNLGLDELEDRAEEAERQAREVIDGLAGIYGSAQAAFDRQAEEYQQAVRRRDEQLQDELERFRDSVRGPILDAGDLISTFGRRAEAVSGDEIVSMLDHRLEAVRRYKAGLETLRTSGINEELLTGLAQAGPGAVNLVEALAGGDPAEINRRLAEMAALGEDVSSVFLERNRAAITDRVNRENTLPVMRSFNDLLAEELQRQTDAQVARNEAMAWAERMYTSTLPGLTGQYGALTSGVLAYAAALRAAAAAEGGSGSPYAQRTSPRIAGPGGILKGLPVKTYDSGGFLPPGWSLAGNFTGAPEAVGGGGVMFAPGSLVVSVRVEDGEVADVRLSGPAAGTGLGKALRVVSHGARV